MNCDFIPQDENIDKHAKVPERTLKGNTPRVHASVPFCASSEHSEKMDYFFWPHQNIFQFKLFWTKPQWIINLKKNQGVITFYITSNHRFGDYSDSFKVFKSTFIILCKCCDIMYT